jgi:diguanylate cyclase (GGDEF)-like protein
MVSSQYDRLTGVYNRETILSMLYRETDRAQRMQGPLCMILFDVDGFCLWNSRLGASACDELLQQIVERTSRQLRSYDLLGRVGRDEFLIGMPGCGSYSALMFTARLSGEAFGTPFRVDDEVVRLSASFGISSSQGRSPLVVLREAEQALAAARASGTGSIHCFGERREFECQGLTEGPATAEALTACDDLPVR